MKARAKRCSARVRSAVARARRSGRAASTRAISASRSASGKPGLPRVALVGNLPVLAVKGSLAPSPVSSSPSSAGRAAASVGPSAIAASAGAWRASVTPPSAMRRATSASIPASPPRNTRPAKPSASSPSGSPSAASRLPVARSKASRADRIRSTRSSIDSPVKPCATASRSAWPGPEAISSSTVPRSSRAAASSISWKRGLTPASTGKRRSSEAQKAWMVWILSPPGVSIAWAKSLRA